MSLEGRIRALEQLAFDTIPSKLAALEIHEKTARQAFMGIPPWGFGMSPEPSGPKTPCCSGVRIPATLKCVITGGGIPDRITMLNWQEVEQEWNGILTYEIWGNPNPIELEDGSFLCGYPPGNIIVNHLFRFRCNEVNPGVFRFVGGTMSKRCNTGLGGGWIPNLPGDYNYFGGFSQFDPGSTTIRCKPFALSSLNIKIFDPANPI